MNAPLPPVLSGRETTSQEPIDARLTAANDHLNHITATLWDGEHAVYSGAILAAAHYANHGDELAAHRRLDQLREMVADWILPRLAGLTPEPADWFGIGAACSFEPSCPPLPLRP